MPDVSADTKKYGTIRIQVPKGTSRDDAMSLLNAEYDRREKSENFGKIRVEEAQKGAAAGVQKVGGPAERGMQSFTQSLYDSPFLADKRLPEIGRPGYEGQDTYFAGRNQPPQTGPEENFGPKMEDLGTIGSMIPILGPLYNLYKTASEEGMPEALGSLAGSSIGAPPVNTLAARSVGRGFQRGAQAAAPPSSYHALRYGLPGILGEGAGRAVGMHPFTGAAAGIVASRIPSFLRGFKSGMSESIPGPLVETGEIPQPAQPGVSPAGGYASRPPNYGTPAGPASYPAGLLTPTGVPPPASAFPLGAANINPMMPLSLPEGAITAPKQLGPATQTQMPPVFSERLQNLKEATKEPSALETERTQLPTTEETVTPVMEPEVASEITEEPKTKGPKTKQVVTTKWLKEKARVTGKSVEELKKELEAEGTTIKSSKRAKPKD